MDSGSSSNMSFVQPKITKKADKVAVTYQFVLDCFQISYMDYFYQSLNMGLVSIPRWPPKWPQPIGLHL